MIEILERVGKRHDHDLDVLRLIEDTIRELFNSKNFHDIFYTDKYNNSLNIEKAKKVKTLVAFVKRASNLYSLNYRNDVNCLSQELAFKRCLHDYETVLFTYVDDFYKIKRSLDNRFSKSIDRYYIIENKYDLDEAISFINK